MTRSLRIWIVTFCLYIAGLHQVIRSCPTNNYQVLGTCEFKILIVLKHFMLLHHRLSKLMIKRNVTNLSPKIPLMYKPYRTKVEGELSYETWQRGM